MTADPKPSTSTIAGVLVAAVTVAIWSSFIIIGRGGARRTLTPSDIAFARFVGSGVVMIPWALWLRRSRNRSQPSVLTLSPSHPFTLSRFDPLSLSPLNLKLTAAVGLLAGWGYALFAYTGFVYAPAAHASVLIPGSLPLWTTAIGVWWLKDRLTAARVLGLALIVAGGLFVGGNSLVHAAGGGVTWKGDLLFVSASWCWAGYSNVIRRYSLEAIKATLAIVVFTSTTYVPAYAFLLWIQAAPSQVSQASWSEIAFQMAYQGVGPVVIAGITFTSMVRRFGPVRSTMVTALVPGLSALGAVVLLGEPLQWNLVAGLALVTVGIVVGLTGTTGPTGTTGTRSAQPCGEKKAGGP